MQDYEIIFRTIGNLANTYLLMMIPDNLNLFLWIVIEVLDTDYIAN